MGGLSVKMLSDACEYGLRACLWLAHRSGETHKASEIAEAIQAAPGYLVKVLQRLAKAGILSAQRGSLGGFTLERDPDDLTVLDVFNAIDPVERITSCPLGIGHHSTGLCPMHRHIDEVIEHIEVSFGSVTVADLLARSNNAEPLCTGVAGALESA